MTALSYSKMYYFAPHNLIVYTDPGDLISLSILSQLRSRRPRVQFWAKKPDQHLGQTPLLPQTQFSHL